MESIEDLEATPEPATLILLGTTMAGLVVTGWKRRGRVQESGQQA